MIKATVKLIEYYLPETIIDNHQIEERISNHSEIGEKSGILARLFGSKTRRFADSHTQVSDLACKAARQILEKTPKESIELLIFAAASSDLIEPATANIIQTKLGLTCPVMDVKNACNSFVSAMQVASAFIELGTYDNILIVNGEKLSEVIYYEPKSYDEYVKYLAGYTLGDAGAAMLMGKGDSGHIIYQKFTSLGQYWNLCTVKGGGSIAYRDPLSYFFESDSKKLLDVFLDITHDFVIKALDAANWDIKTINHVVTHQISSTSTKTIAEGLGIDHEKFSCTFSRYGNIAAATIPIALSELIEQDKVKRGDKLMLIGFAAGVSLSVQLIEW